MKIFHFFILLLLISANFGCSLFSKKDTESHSRPVVIKYSNFEAEAHQKILNLNMKNAEPFSPSIYNQLNYEAVSFIEETLLHAATALDNNNDKIFDEILFRTHNIDRPSVFSKTPLTIAVENNDLYKTKKLLDKGANVDHLEFLSNPIFFITLKTKNKEMLKLLISYNFNPTQMGFMDRYWKDISTSTEIALLMKEYDQKYFLKMQQELLKSKTIKSRSLIDKIINAN